MKKNRIWLIMLVTVALAGSYMAACDFGEGGDDATEEEIQTADPDVSTGPACGDNACNGNEDCASCPGDCGECGAECGDDACNGDEDCTTCAADCGECPECECDYNGGICEAAENPSTVACDCDPDCEGGGQACSADGHCDTYCPKNEDPDCEGCECDYNDGICEPESDGSDTACDCDTDCADTDPCGEDGHCDTWCDPGGVCQDIDCPTFDEGECEK